ncbi:hypothetical protein [Longimicrobium sp.]|uniref:hypothetical protein n=1 Tax=Longimicrobium sp. TaxID=2029185 RepID=UPI002E36D49D|nr:hypothetical protein [Longimicrobium sp.]HEX6036572.1 hypothetical protein [Longimicrobium sp.]
MRAIRAAVLLLALAACTPAAARGGGDVVTGRVSLAGSAPMDVHVRLRPAEGPSVWVDGPLRAEIGRLGGAEVEVRGRLQSGTLTADSYRIVRVDGRPVLMGMVEVADGGLRLRMEDGRVVRLGSPPPEIRPGQKVWVQGPGDPAVQVQVQTFGIITP